MLQYGNQMNCEENWSMVKFQGSSETPAFRRYMFPGIYPTMVANTAEIAALLKSAAPTPSSPTLALTGLPLLAGHAMFWSWYWAQVDAIAANDTDKIVKLHEAVLTVTVRVRASPKRSQSLVDACSWSESVRNVYSACADSFVQFLVKTGDIPEIRNAKGIQGLIDSYKACGITYRNKECNRHFCVGVNALRPFIVDLDIAVALSDLEEFRPKVTADPTRLSRMAQTVANMSQSIDTMKFIVRSLLSVLRQGHITDKDVVVEWLIGDTKTPGWAHATAKKRCFLQWLFAELLSNASPDDGARITKVKDIFESPTDFDTHFIFHTFDAEADEYTCDAQESARKLKELVDAEEKDSLKTLTKLLYDIQSSVYDDEFGEMSKDQNLVFAVFCADDKNESPLAQAVKHFYQLWHQRPVSLEKVASEKVEPR